MKNYLAIALIWLLLSGFSHQRSIDRIIIHHSGVNVDQTVEQIRDYHVNHNGWDDIGYHYIIYRDGSIHKGREDSVVGAHAKGRNHNSLGICLIGDDEISTEQIGTLIVAIRELRMIYGKNLKLETHHNKCPGVFIIDALHLMEFEIKEIK